MGLLHVRGCWVRERDGDRRGVVLDARPAGRAVEVRVRWHDGGGEEWTRAVDLRCGFPLGIEVEDVPLSPTRSSLGIGWVLDVRELGGAEQVLVEFVREGERLWLPYEKLRAVRGPGVRFTEDPDPSADAALRFRLRNLAYAMEMWNRSTGALSRLGVDPLPHQIHLVHHILRSSSLNWLIADDVGLGKTIEVGLLISALERRGWLRRVLIVTPAGLVRQWREEMHHRFGLEGFRIYNVDFRIDDDRFWKLYDHVIVSVDTMKSPPHLERFERSGRWDLVVFDEAHRLTRYRSGAHWESSDRFRAAAAIRRLTDAMLLLTATPHQGQNDKFVSLLELLRPDLRDRLERLSRNPEVIREIVIRNSKGNVTDLEGNFVFHGVATATLSVEVGEEGRAFDAALQRYVRHGYATAAADRNRRRAVGFVMTMYRKLAASSIAAIVASLRRRLEALEGDGGTRDGAGAEAAMGGVLGADEDSLSEREDERFLGEVEEARARAYERRRREFFSGEAQMLRDLLRLGEAAGARDEKLRWFLEEVVPALLEMAAEERLVVFTEYRATQAYLAEALEARYGSGAVHLIHGGLDFAEREAAIRGFETDGMFLISTEAGGEGINLHRRCHVMVNYDLPWNPMRVVQRIGRLYRYGQTRKVVVGNVVVRGTIDGEILGTMYQKIWQAAEDLAPVDEAVRERMLDEILGEIAEGAEVSAILERAVQRERTVTEAELDAAVRRAREAARKQQEIFDHATSFDEKELASEVRIDAGHVKAFVEGMARVLGIEVAGRSRGGRVLEVRLPDDLAREMGLRQRRRVRITFDRAAWEADRSLEMMDMRSRLFSYLLERAKDRAFAGLVAGVRGLPARALATVWAGWADEQGRRLREELIPVLVDEGGGARIDPEAFGTWLAGGGVGDDGDDGEACPPPPREEREAMLTRIYEEADARAGSVAGRGLFPENVELLSAAWVCGKAVGSGAAGPWGAAARRRPEAAGGRGRPA